MKMAAYFTRQVHRPPGFYRQLNARSSLDGEAGGECNNGRRQKTDRTAMSESDLLAEAEDVYEVERLIQRRCGKVKTSFPSRLRCRISSHCRAGLSTSSYGRGIARRRLPGSESATLHAQRYCKHFQYKYNCQ